MNDQDLVPMGYVSGAFGIRGWIKVHADTERADNLFAYQTWWIGKIGGDWSPYHVCDSALQNKSPVAQLDGIDDRDAAFALRGLTVAVPRSELPVLANDEYYWSDLIGLRVIGNDNQDLGCITEMMQTGAHDVMLVKNESEQHLIPFVEPILLKVDLSEHCVFVAWSADYLS